jgi:hypothetical protein
LPIEGRGFDGETLLSNNAATRSVKSKPIAFSSDNTLINIGELRLTAILRKTFHKR